MLAGFVVWLTWILATLARSPRPFAYDVDVELHGSVSKQRVVGTPRYRGLQRNRQVPLLPLRWATHIKVHKWSLVQYVHRFWGHAFWCTGTFLQLARSIARSCRQHVQICIPLVALISQSKYTPLVLSFGINLRGVLWGMEESCTT